MGLLPEPQPDEPRTVGVSVAMARLLFTECGPACIAENGCSGKCCDAPTRPTGCMVTVHPSEVGIVRATGKVLGINPLIQSNLLQPTAGGRGCPFKLEGLCRLHGTPGKPFGCVASPFTLNANDTLIIRNRYKMLPCYRGPGKKDFAYRVFRSSLDLIFGKENAAELCGQLDRFNPKRPYKFIATTMPAESYRMLKDNDAIKKAVSK